MRLLNTRSLQFEEFFDSQHPMYVILSHRWGDDEVSYQDFRKGRKQDTQGHAKIKQCCIYAQSRGFDRVWIDTCCIDKKSSAELSEAINSMFRWYQGAVECYAYMSDVVWKSDDEEASKKSFKQSLWFTRGWTLQELLAPSRVIFLDRQWKYFGDRRTLSMEISDATRIKHEHLRNWHGACIATKMSWVSERVTSRVEDMAYCMLGFFDVNMPLLYGEGEKAFTRLQLEIIKKSDDESIFAWTALLPRHGMLAPHPCNFAQSGDITIHQDLKKKRFPYVMTNQGLEFQAPYRDLTSAIQGETYDLPTTNTTALALNCWREGHEGPLAVTIKLARFGNTWQRVGCDELDLSKYVLDSLAGNALAKTKRTALLYIPQEGL